VVDGHGVVVGAAGELRHQALDLGVMGLDQLEQLAGVRSGLLHAQQADTADGPEQRQHHADGRDHAQPDRAAAQKVLVGVHAGCCSG
jgi:hypothetical protein